LSVTREAATMNAAMIAMMIIIRLAEEGVLKVMEAIFEVDIAPAASVTLT